VVTEVVLGATVWSESVSGLRTIIGSMVGHDHVITHVTGQLIPAAFLTLVYPVLIVQGKSLVNGAATALGRVAIGDGWAHQSTGPR
jgi:hypothetical protein